MLPQSSTVKRSFGMQAGFHHGLLLQLAGVVLLLVVGTTRAAAQGATPFEIADNSFLVEEAFNQEAGIFQNIFNVRAAGEGDWEASFTQEWPVVSQTHQFSYTLPYAAVSGRTGVGDVLLNYRWQATMERGRVPALSPRVSLILPSGRARAGLGNGGIGWQVNLPVSKQFGDLYLHVNGGFTHLPDAGDDTFKTSLITPHAAMSGIVRIRPMFHLMFEGVVEWEESIEALATRRDAIVTLSPGFRAGWNNGDAQSIWGVAIPVEIVKGDSNVGVFGYFSYELPFLGRP